MSATLALLSAVLAGAPVAEEVSPAAGPAATRSVRLLVGVQLGVPHPFGATARATLRWNGRPRFDLDVQWEPSAYLQSYSLGGAWRPADSLFYVGPRLRLVQFRPPWGRGYRVDSDNFFGVGLEAGARFELGASRRAVLSVGLQANWIPAQAASLSLMIGAAVGLTYVFLERGL